MDEYGIIELLTRTAGRLPAGYSPIGDDVATLPSSPGRLVLKADMLVGRTDVPPGMTWRQAGRKAVAMCVSDFASKGVPPLALMVSLGIPRSLGEKGIRALAGGFRDGIDEWSLHLVGGDTNEADDVIVDCILAGFTDRVVGRGGASPGELVVVTGEFGTTSAGLKILLEGARSAPGFRRAALENVYRPSPRLRPGLALRDYLSAAMDSSDGLAICLHTIAEAGGVGIRVERLPYARRLAKFASDNRYAVDELVLYGGEEYEIVGTVPRNRIRQAEAAAEAAGSALIVIGETTGERKIAMADGRPIEKRGWIQLS
ncbi:MAG: thiamine-phosphate kinase [Thaumarchaeota archaeon]|nr:thiamine-phosphate kinase [Nitrososphaerota archaeon]